MLTGVARAVEVRRIRRESGSVNFMVMVSRCRFERWILEGYNGDDWEAVGCRWLRWWVSCLESLG